MSDDESDENDDRTETGARSSVGNVGPAPSATADMAALGHALGTSDSNLAQRYMVARNAGLAFGNDRDYYAVLGYNRDPDAEDYFAKYIRNDIARRVVDAYPKASWSGRPTIVDEANEGTDDEAETEFEQAVEYLFDEHRLLHYLERVDKVAGIGEYGILFLGLAADDTVGLDDDASTASFRSVLDTRNEGGPDDLAYLATFSQARVQSLDPVENPADPRFGLPDTYGVEFSTARTSRTETVHHSRIIHVAEGVLENEIYGRPRLEAVLNRVEDLEKVVGGSAEMFWRGADRKLHLNYTGEGTPRDAEDMAEQAEEMVHGLRDTLRTTNVDLNEIQGNEVDPSGVVEQILKLIAGETGIPLRMLTGSERGELASTQDRATFYERVEQRREQFCEPAILRPLLDRLVTLGVLPEPQGDGYAVEWPELFDLNELERADLMEKQANALKAAAPMGDPANLGTPAEIRENVLSWDPERGGETSLDPEDEPAGGLPDEGDPDVTDETGEDRDAFEDLLGNGDGVAPRGAARPDGGSED
ncbi:portal protein [Halorubrum phage Hardycor1]|nr:portal protein [Halorubrum phage Hardycor1]